MQRTNQLMRIRNITARQARQLIPKLLKLIKTLKASGFKPLVTLAKTLANWDEAIVCMWRFSKSNGITEGFHRKMKLIQRRAYGFKNFDNYRRPNLPLESGSSSKNGDMSNFEQEFLHVSRVERNWNCRLSGQSH
jgi:hypothetical protein